MKVETLAKFSCKVFIFESYKVKTLQNRDAKFSVRARSSALNENFGKVFIHSVVTENFA